MRFSVLLSCYTLTWNRNPDSKLLPSMRLVEGGSVALGEGDSRGYVEICDGLCVKVSTSGPREPS